MSNLLRHQEYSDRAAARMQHPPRARYNRRVTKFAVCFLLVFGELAVGGMFALAIPPFFKIERGFYKSTACVYLASALMATVGLGMLAWRATGNHMPGPDEPLDRMRHMGRLLPALRASMSSRLWTDLALLRARAFSLGLLAGLIAVRGVGPAAQARSIRLDRFVAYVITAVTSAMVLGLVSGAMMFGHWYLIDLGMDVEYLRSFIRIIGYRAGRRPRRDGARVGGAGDFRRTWRDHRRSRTCSRIISRYF